MNEPKNSIYLNCPKVLACNISSKLRIPSFPFSRLASFQALSLPLSSKNGGWRAWYWGYTAFSSFPSQLLSGFMTLTRTGSSVTGNCSRCWRRWWGATSQTNSCRRLWTRQYSMQTKMVTGKYHLMNFVRLVQHGGSSLFYIPLGCVVGDTEALWPNISLTSHAAIHFIWRRIKEIRKRFGCCWPGASSSFSFPLLSLPLPQVVGTLDVPSKMVIDLKGD